MKNLYSFQTFDRDLAQDDMESYLHPQGFILFESAEKALEAALEDFNSVYEQSITVQDLQRYPGQNDGECEYNIGNVHIFVIQHTFYGL